MSFEGYPPPPPGTPPSEYEWAPPVGPPTASGPTPTAPRRRRGRVALALVAGGAVIAGVSAWTAIMVTSPSARSAAGTAATTSAPGAAAGRHGSAAKPAVSGTITTESGSTWTLKTSDGASYTVTIGHDTKFGTVKSPEQQSTFVAGTAVKVMGSTSGATVDATRVALAHAAGGAGAAPSGGAAPSAGASPSTDIFS